MKFMKYKTQLCDRYLIVPPYVMKGLKNEGLSLGNRDVFSKLSVDDIYNMYTLNIHTSSIIGRETGAVSTDIVCDIEPIREFLLSSGYTAEELSNTHEDVSIALDWSNETDETDKDYDYDAINSVMYITPLYDSFFTSDTELSYVIVKRLLNTVMTNSTLLNWYIKQQIKRDT